MENQHWVILVGLLVLGGIGMFLVSWLGNRKRAQDELGILQTRVNELTTRVFNLQDEAAASKKESTEQMLKMMKDQSACKSENADLKAELHALSIRQRETEAKTGTLSLSPIPGVVVADLKGTVRIFSPSLTPMLGWLPDEVQGRKIDILIPPELLEQHKAGFDHAVAAGVPARDRPLITYALAKSGARVPVSIFLKSLQPEGLITAEIRQRASGEPAEK